MIWLAWWAAFFGIAPLAWPEHNWADVWFPADLVAHLAGVTYIILHARKQWWKNRVR